MYRLRDDLAIVQTVDVFTPVVDDPYHYGAISAANALSDVYAMGAVPLLALAIVGFPRSKLPMDVLEEILRGGIEKTREAGVTIAGGHSIDDPEPKYGLAVTGVVHPDRIVRNVGAQPGDQLVLTKPLGIGILTTGIKQGKTSPEAAAEAVRVSYSAPSQSCSQRLQAFPRNRHEQPSRGLRVGEDELLAGLERSEVHFCLQVFEVPCGPTGDRPAVRKAAGFLEDGDPFEPDGRAHRTGAGHLVEVSQQPESRHIGRGMHADLDHRL